MSFLLERNGGLCKLTPWEPGLEDTLSYTKREFDPTVRGRAKRPTLTKERLYEVLDEGAGVFPAGLRSRVEAALKAQGAQVSYKDYRDISSLMPEPDFSTVEALRTGQEKVLLAVASNDGGLIVGGTGMGKSFLIRQICRMYPTLNIVVATPRRAVVGTLYDEIRKALGPMVVGKVGGGSRDSGKRVVVSTAKSLLRCDMDKCDLLLFDEAHGVGANKIAEDLARFTRPRKFGFTATPEGRGDNAELVMEALFGPVLVDIPYEDALDKGLVSPIEVHKYSVPCAGGFDERSAMVAKKRWAYWRNTERNKTIASVASSIPDDERVLIMVETLEHAIYLHKLLPDFVVVHGGSGGKKYVGGVSVAKYPSSPKRLAWARREFRDGKLRKVISTKVWVEGVDFPDLAVLIRADGASSPIMAGQIPGRLSRLSVGKDQGVLIDFGDEFSMWTRRRSQERHKVYRSNGWPIIGKLTPEV